MSGILDDIQKLIIKGEVRISEHGYDELSEDGLFAREVVEGIATAIIVEEYPNYPKGPSYLLLQKDREDNPIHVVWGFPKGYTSPVVLVTAYKPDPDLWEKDFIRRRK